MSSKITIQLQTLFSEIENHSSFFVRKRIYIGGGLYGDGLQPIHIKYNDIMQKLDTIPDENIKANSKLLESTQLKLLDTIRIVSSIDGLSENKTDLVKYINLASHELEELIKVIDDIEKFDPSKIADPEEVRLENISRLQGIIEDNLNQLTKSFTWKSSVAELKNKIDGQQVIDSRWALLLEAKMQLQLLENLKTLETMSSFSAIVRNLCGKDITMMEKNLPVMIAFLILFQRDGELIKSDFSVLSNQHLTVEDIRSDLEHLLNTNRLSWISALHEQIVGRSYNLEKIKKFAARLYEMSRDVKEEFLWTMTTVARANNTPELEEVSVGFATLASCLLSITGTLDENGLYDLSKKITEIERLNVIDAITDLSELYQPENINVTHLIRAIDKKLDSLKELALQVISFDDIKVAFFNVVQFTDFNAGLANIEDLGRYIDNLGKL